MHLVRITSIIQLLIFVSLMARISFSKAMTFASSSMVLKRRLEVYEEAKKHSPSSSDLGLGDSLEDLSTSLPPAIPSIFEPLDCPNILNLGEV